jgi:hypothetical protein
VRRRDELVQRGVERRAVGVRVERLVVGRPGGGVCRLVVVGARRGVCELLQCGAELGMVQGGRPAVPSVEADDVEVGRLQVGHVEHRGPSFRNLPLSAGSGADQGRVRVIPDTENAAVPPHWRP